MHCTSQGANDGSLCMSLPKADRATEMSGMAPKSSTIWAPRKQGNQWLSDALKPGRNKPGSAELIVARCLALLTMLTEYEQPAYLDQASASTRTAAQGQLAAQLICSHAGKAPRSSFAVCWGACGCHALLCDT